MNINSNVSSLQLSSPEYKHDTIDFHTFQNNGQDQEEEKNKEINDHEDRNSPEIPTNVTLRYDMDKDIDFDSVDIDDGSPGVVMKTLNFKEFTEFSPRARTRLKKLYENSTYLSSKLIAGQPFLKEFNDHDVKVLHKVFGIERDQKYVTLTTLEEGFIDVLKGENFNVLYEILESKSGGMICRKDLMNTSLWKDSLTQDEKIHIDKFFGFLPSLKRKELENVPTTPTKKINSSESIISTPTIVTPRSTFGTPTSSVATTSVVDTGGNTCVATTSVISTGRDNSCHISSHELNAIRNRRKIGKISVNIYERTNNEESMQGSNATLVARISHPLIYTNAARYFIYLNWPEPRRRPNSSGSYFLWQPYFLPPIMESVQKTMIEEDSIPFERGLVDLAFETVDKNTTPGSNIVSTYTKGKSVYKHQHLTLLLTIGGYKFDEWCVLADRNITQQRSLVENIATTYIKAFFCHRTFEYNFIKFYDAKEFATLEFNNQGVNDKRPIKNIQEYPKKDLSEYLSRMSRAAASTKAKPSEHFQKLRNCDISFHHDLVLYEHHRPSDIEDMMRKCKFIPDENSKNDSNLETVFSVSKWYGIKQEPS